MAKRHSNRSSLIRVVLYLRMSSAGQDQSIPAQRTELRAYAKKHGYEIVGEYIDEAISGDDTERRTGFLQMRDDAQAGEFGVVLCWDQDRFGRFDQLDAGHWIYPFRLAGVRLETIAQGRIDWEDLTGQLIYSVNQMGKSPKDTKKLLSSIVTRIELHFDEGNGRQKRTFSHGEIYVRPDAGQSRGSQPDGEVALLSRKRPISRTPCHSRFPSRATNAGSSDNAAELQPAVPIVLVVTETLG